MRSDRLEKLNMWLVEQLAALKAEGASEKELKDPALADLALRKIFEEHFDQLCKDEEFIREAYNVVSNRTHPNDLCELAAQARKEGELEIGSYLELIADYREMTFWADSSALQNRNIWLIASILACRGKPTELSFRRTTASRASSG